MDIHALLHERLTVETRWILAVLLEESRKVAKEELWKIVNERYQQKKGVDEVLIKSRHFLDSHMNRLEGAALVNLTKIGQVRLYEISALGKNVLTFK